MQVKTYIEHMVQAQAERVFAERRIFRSFSIDFARNQKKGQRNKANKWKEATKLRTNHA